MILTNAKEELLLIGQSDIKNVRLGILMLKKHIGMSGEKLNFHNLLIVNS